jgi:hypothetical protein
MSVGSSPPTQSIAEYWRPAQPILLALATAALLFSALFYNSPFCPAATLIGGSNLPLGIAGGALGAFLGMLALGLTHYFRKALAITRPQQGSIVNASWMTVLVWRWIGAGILALSLLAWAHSMVSYYCVSLRSIAIYPSAVAKTKVYSWTEVAGVKVGCGRNRRGAYGFFALHLKDGSVVSLQGWENHICEIDRALAAVPFAYDDTEAADCPSPYRELLGHRPGA